MMKGNKGITLIALIVTIIVLIILAGVAIAMLSGNNGVIDKATEARYENVISGFDEKVRMAQMAMRTDITSKMIKNPAYLATEADVAAVAATQTTPAVEARDGNFTVLAQNVAKELGVVNANGTAKLNVKATNNTGYSVYTYLTPGSTTKNGTGYILITYSDNSLRSSLPGKDITAATDSWVTNAVSLKKAGWSSASQNEAVLAYVIRVSNYGCDLSPAIITDYTNENDITLKTGTGIAGTAGDNVASTFNSSVIGTAAALIPNQNQ